ECVGAADLYDGRHTLAKEITGNPNLPTSREYKQLLDRKDIDCIVAAVPDHWHRRVVVDACNAGKDIYCEKPMSHNVAGGLALLESLRDGCCGRPDGALDQWHALHPGVERGSAIGDGDGRDLPI